MCDFDEAAQYIQIYGWLEDRNITYGDDEIVEMVGQLCVSCRQFVKAYREFEVWKWKSVSAHLTMLVTAAKVITVLTVKVYSNDSLLL
jgi:hypothetical protein